MFQGIYFFVVLRIFSAASNSSSIVFEDRTSSEKNDNPHRRLSSSEALEPPLVLVDNDTAMETSRESKDHIYLYIQMEVKIFLATSFCNLLFSDAVSALSRTQSPQLAFEK